MTSTTDSRPRSAPVLSLALLILAVAPAPTRAVPPNRSIALEITGGRRPGGGALGGGALSAGCWLEGEVEATVRLAVGSVPRPVGRGADLAVTPEAGVRWSPDEGRWRPALALSVGLRLPAAGRETAPTALLQGGLERRLAPGWALAAALGARWTAGSGTAAEAGAGLRLSF